MTNASASQPRGLVVEFPTQRIMQVFMLEVTEKMQQGYKYYQEKQYYKALQCYLWALSVEKNCPWLWFNIGVAYEAIHNAESAIRAYEQCIELNPRFSQAVAFLADLCMNQQQYGKAAKYLQKYLKLEPSSPERKAIKKKLKECAVKSGLQMVVD